jgi:hypothetical protein
LASPCPSLMVMTKMTRHKAGLSALRTPPSAEKPCSYDPDCSLLRSCRPLGLPAKGNLHCRTIKSMAIRLGLCANL